MRKVLYLVVLFLIIIAATIFSTKIANPTSGQAISFVKKRILNDMGNSDSLTFDEVKFHPDASPQGDSISGVVCGYITDNNLSMSKKRFVSDIVVSNSGRSARMASPVIESKEDSNNMDALWASKCK
jgi:hypothetical protein